MMNLKRKSGKKKKEKNGNMLYSLLDTKANLFYNFKRYNQGKQWESEWWLAYKYHKIDKAEKHKAILEDNGFIIEIQEHSKLELTKIPDEKWKTTI